MKRAYVDTSVLVARAFDETTAADAQSLLLQYDVLYSAALTEAEFAAAHRRERRNLDLRLLDMVSWVLPNRTLRTEIRAVAGASVQVRGADLWHVACALYVSPDAQGFEFLTMDTKQAAVAREMGFTVLPV